jgi:ABC-type amino acid transport system permease subunit
MMIVGILLGIELIAGRFRRIFRALIASIRNNVLLDDDSRKLYLQDLKFAIRSTVIASFFTALIGFINFLHTMSEPATIGANIGIITVSFFHGLVIVALIFALRERLKK